jgi:hypothetical protein
MVRAEDEAADNDDEDEEEEEADADWVRPDEPTLLMGRLSGLGGLEESAHIELGVAGTA